MVIMSFLPVMTGNGNLIPPLKMVSLCFYGPHPSSSPQLQGWGSGPPVSLVLHPGIEPGSDAWGMRLIHKNIPALL